jgi:GNAT superfamily N-acetyltransferase
MIRITTDPAAMDLRLAHRWLASTQWAANIPWETFERACEHSLLYAAFDSAEQVGIARAVTDHATFAWLADVYVAEHARRRGAAAALMTAIMDDPRLQGLRRFVLVTADAHGLYERFGFERIGDTAGRFMVMARTAAELDTG